MNRVRSFNVNWLVLLAAVSGAGVALAEMSRPMISAKSPAATAEPAARAIAAAPVDWSAFTSASAPEPTVAEDDAASVAGDVLEQIDVGKYSYLRLGQPGLASVWAAVPKTATRVGEHVVVQDAELMTNFESATLKRRFEKIYFGRLGYEHDQADEIAPESDRNAPHPGPGKSADNVKVGNIRRAAGPLAHTVAELHTRPDGLAGKPVRVRGVIVKSTPGVLGHTFLHLRDGSGSAQDGSNDLTVTTSVEPGVGAQVVLEGTLLLDQDFGAGYRYDVLLTNATLVTE